MDGWSNPKSKSIYNFIITTSERKEYLYSLKDFSAESHTADFLASKIQEIIEEVGGTAATTLMIGDSPTDMEMAKYVQVTSVGVDFYHQQTAELKAAGAVAVFDDYTQLADYLNLTK